MSPEPTLADYLLALRGSLSQKAAAAKVGTSRRQWIRWETEGKGIDEVNADKIAKAFRRPKSELRRYVRSRPRPEEILATLQRLGDRLEAIEKQAHSQARAIEKLQQLVHSQDEPTSPQKPEDVRESS